MLGINLSIPDFRVACAAEDDSSRVKIDITWKNDLVHVYEFESIKVSIF